MMQMEAQGSLRVRLLRLLFVPLLLGIAAIGTASYLGAYHETEEVYDAQLVHFARVLHQLTAQRLGHGDVAAQLLEDHGPQLQTYEKNMVYRVWHDGRLMLQSAGGEALGTPTQVRGFADRTIGQIRWRIFVFRQQDITVEVAEEYEVRLDLIRHVLSGIFLPQLLFVPLVMTIIWLGVRRALAPLKKLGGQIRSRTPASLEPLRPEMIPQEVAPMVEAINDLMRRMGEVLEKEKDFSNLAAHQLRTPLAALKTQLQVALREPDMSAREQLFREALGSIDRMTHLVAQLLLFARMQALDAQAMVQPVALVPLLQALEEEYRLAAAQKQIALTLHCDEANRTATTTGNGEWLRVMLDTLLENAIAYSPPDTVIGLSLERQSQGWMLTITDQGRGIAPEDLPRIFDRFYRARDVASQGAGLGLAIASQIAQMHKIVLSASSDGVGKGSRFYVLFAARAPLPEERAPAKNTQYMQEDSAEVALAPRAAGG